MCTSPLAVLMCAILVGCGGYGLLAPAASADSVTEFSDNPSIVDNHPLHFESWRVVGEDVVSLQFTTGTPECYGVHAIVHESPEAVMVELRGGTLPEAVGRACIMIAVFGSLDVQLQAPLGDREVISL
jgi:hypothetical protein